jgi:hypothetical protein
MHYLTRFQARIQQIKELLWSLQELMLAIAMQWNLVMAVKLIRTLSNRTEENEEKQPREVNSA